MRHPLPADHVISDTKLFFVPIKGCRGGGGLVRASSLQQAVSHWNLTVDFGKYRRPTGPVRLATAAEIEQLSDTNTPNDHSATPAPTNPVILDALSSTVRVIGDPLGGVPESTHTPHDPSSFER